MQREATITVDEGKEDPKLLNNGNNINRDGRQQNKNAKQGKIGNKTGQNRAQQGRTELNRAKQSTKHGRTGLDKTTGCQTNL